VYSFWANLVFHKERSPNSKLRRSGTHMKRMQVNFNHCHLFLFHWEYISTKDLAPHSKKRMQFYITVKRYIYLCSIPKAILREIQNDRFKKVLSKCLSPLPIEYAYRALAVVLYLLLSLPCHLTLSESTFHTPAELTTTNLEVSLQLNLQIRETKSACLISFFHKQHKKQRREIWIAESISNWFLKYTLTHPHGHHTAWCANFESCCVLSSSPGL